jgi:hypothetical protein
MSESAMSVMFTWQESNNSRQNSLLFFGKRQDPLKILVPCESTSLCFEKCLSYIGVASGFAQENNNWFDRFN